MNKDHCCRECRRLGETTSLKGIPRIIKSKHIVLKVLWTICTITFVSLALYQAAVLLLDFFSFPEITDLDEHSVDLLTDTSVQLPQVTICNLNPLSTRAMQRTVTRQPPFINFKDFIQGGQDAIEIHYNHSAQRELLRTQLLTTRGYFAFLGPENAQVMGHTQAEFIASCKVLVLQGLDLDEEDCSKLANITLFQHSKYFNCYTVAMHEQTETNIMVGYSLTLQLGNYPTEEPWSALLDTQRRQYLGALLAIHAPNTYPLIIEEGYAVAPGTHVNLRYSLEQRDRLPEPHGNCETSERFVENISEKMSVSIPYEYTKPMCISVGLEYDIIMECNCTDLTLMQILQTDQLTDCGELRQYDVRAMLDQVTCAKNIRKTRLQEVMKQCPDPCHQLRYIAEISESVWPPYPVTRNFYDELIAGRPYEEQYISVKEAIAARTNGTSTETPQQLAALEAFTRQNFVNIDVFLGRLRKLQIIDSPKITKTSLMSQLGGTLNLWAGITIVLVIEFVEYLLRTFVLPENA